MEWLRRILREEGDSVLPWRRDAAARSRFSPRSYEDDDFDPEGRPYPSGRSYGDYEESRAGDPLDRWARRHAELAADPTERVAMPGPDGGYADMVRHEEELVVAPEWMHAGALQARTEVEQRSVEQVVPCLVEEAEVRRVPVEDGDTGEVFTLPDGSISIPVLEERLVVRKQIVVIERVLLGKRVTTEERLLRAELRSQRIRLDTSDADGRVIDTNVFATVPRDAERVAAQTSGPALKEGDQA